MIYAIDGTGWTHLPVTRGHARENYKSAISINSMPMRRQRTLRRAVRLVGVGLHSGQAASVELLPMPAGSGVSFRCGSSPGCSVISASVANVDARRSQLCSRLASQATGAGVATVEHLMAALVASGVTNASVQVSMSPSSEREDAELPILDGSSLEFLRAIQGAGVETQRGAKLSYLSIRRPVQVLQNDKAAWLLPRPAALGGAAEASTPPALDLSVHVNFEHKGLGLRVCQFHLGADPEANMEAFAQDIAAARTFTFEDEVEWMRAHELALGGSLDNAVVFANDQTNAEQPRVLNEGGLRFADEWARHKMLDCIGDLGLAGRPIHGYFFATSPGHALTHELLRALFSDERNYELKECE